MKIRKPGELTDDAKRTLKEELRAGCRNMGVNTIYSVPGKRVSMHSKELFGLCRDCGHFKFTATQYAIKIAMCDEDEGVKFPLSEDDPVIECSSYYVRGEQDAHDFSKNAWLLDPPEGKLGF